MKTQIAVFAVVLLIVANHNATATVITISPGPGNTVCPLTNITYTASTNDLYDDYCGFKWYVTGGHFNGPSEGHSVIVVWDDAPGTGTLKAETKYCPTGYTNGLSVTKTYTRISVYGRDIGTSTPATTLVPICGSPTVSININQMTLTGTGSPGQPALQAVDGYRWLIPAGWKLTGTSIVGPTPYVTTSTSINVTPTGVSSGEVGVQAFVSNTCGGTGFTNTRRFTLNRTPDLVFTPASYTTTCGLVAPVTFTIPSFPCATVTWTQPPSWQVQSTTSTSITLKPDGYTGGDLIVTLTFPNGTLSKTMSINYSSTVPKPISISDNNPYYELCSNDIWHYMANLPNGYASNFGFDWYATGGILMELASSSVSTPVHTTSNSSLVTVPSGSYGQQSIYVRMNNLNCTPSAYISIPIRVGTYSNSEFSIIGPQMVCANQAADFRSSFITSDVTGYQWSAPSGWSNSGQGTPYFSVSVPDPFYGGAITLRLQNRCGLTNTPYVLNLSNNCYYGFTISPNPASETLVITDLDPSQEATAVLVDKGNTSLKSETSTGGKIEMDVSKIPNGLYVLKVKQKEKITTEQIVINH